MQTPASVIIHPSVHPSVHPSMHLRDLPPSPGPCTKTTRVAHQSSTLITTLLWQQAAGAGALHGGPDPPRL